MLDDSGRMVAFDSEQQARAHTSNGTFVSTDAAVLYDLDAIDEWARSDGAAPTFSSILQAWNLFPDIPHVEDLFAAAESFAPTVCEGD